MEHIVNQIILTGNLAGAPRYSHENHGRRFYAFPLEVERLSGTTDTLPVLAPLELLEQTPAAGGDTLCVTGQIRSYNNREPEGRRLVISVLAETMTLCSAAHDNRAELLGTICRAPVYRRTPLGREICDVMLAVNRPLSPCGLSALHPLGPHGAGGGGAAGRHAVGADRSAAEPGVYQNARHHGRAADGL